MSKTKAKTKLEDRLGYTFADKSLMTMALTHRSHKAGANNERLEFLGDAVLDLIVGEELYRLFGEASEGEMTRLRAALVSEDSFARLAEYFDLGRELLISASEEKSAGRKKPSLLSNAFEALIGAIYLDGGLREAQRCALAVIHRCYDPITPERLIRDYKTKLQELSQARFGVTPNYELIKADGPDHLKIFEIELSIDGRRYAIGHGSSKKAAEQEAAEQTIAVLEAEDE
ncbi:ribonuclease 3 [Campylobacterota bacterium]|nr:ribonuclease 3 [Campylobacterota bacterium]